MPYLVTAEIDSIQEYIFRSTKMKEIVGASNLIQRFSQEMPKYICNKIGVKFVDVKIISDGGTFLFIFNDDNNKEKGEQFLLYLKEIYAQYYRGLITISDIGDVFAISDFKDNVKKIKDNLSDKKLAGKGFSRTVHIPYASYCYSCGIESAFEYKKEKDGGRALCKTCLIKEKERNSIRKDNPGIFYEYTKRLRCFSLPDSISEIEDIAKLNSKNFIAYIKADGNSIGKLMSSCEDKDTYMKMSEHLSESIWNSYIEISKGISDWIANKTNYSFSKLPTLPLIMGGDDNLFIVPAEVSIDSARNFALLFEKKWKEVDDNNIKTILDNNGFPTISVSVVICKEGFPYRTANEIGEELLEDAKLLHRINSIHSEDKKTLSTINFEVIDSSLKKHRTESGDYIDTLKPYFIVEVNNEISVSINNIFECKELLNEFPNKRLHEFRMVFDETNIPRGAKNKIDDAKIKERFSYFYGRLTADERDVFKLVMAKIGSEDYGLRKMMDFKPLDLQYKNGLIDYIKLSDFLEEIQIQ